MDTICTDQQQQGPLSVAAPHTVHDEEKHSSIATHLLSVVKPIGISSSQVGRMRRRKGGPSSFEVRFLLCGGSSCCASPLVVRFCWRLVEARIHADYSSLVAARTNILCAETAAARPFRWLRHHALFMMRRNTVPLQHLLSAVKPIGVRRRSVNERVDAHR
jgi:hypothetical protein